MRTAWACGGATRLDNLCSLCRRHHRFVHEHGYRIERTSGGELAFSTASGAPVSVPKAPSLPCDAFEHTRHVHAARGLAIGPDTALPCWDGERVAYDLVVEALLAARTRDLRAAP